MLIITIKSSKIRFIKLTKKSKAKSILVLMSGIINEDIYRLRVKQTKLSLLHN